MKKKTISSLPPEILDNILYRLPAETIGRCRCVSKTWLDLLTQPHLIKDHLKHSRKHPTHSLLLISRTSESLFSAPLSNAHYEFNELPTRAIRLCFPNKTEGWKSVIASCDGLVLLSDTDLKMWLVTPTTLAIRALPPLPPAPENRHSVSTYGLGYDKCVDDYTIVSLTYYDAGNKDEHFIKMFVNVFTVKSGAWRKVQISPNDHAYASVDPGEFVNGCIHWIAGTAPDSDSISIIAAFSLCDEKFYKVPLPSSLDGTAFVYDNNLVVLGGCLCIFSAYREGETDVWVMKEYGVKSSWSKFTIADSEGFHYGPLCSLGEEQLALAGNVKTEDGKLVTYDMRQGSMKEITVMGMFPDSFRNCGAHVESLVSPY